MITLQAQAWEIKASLWLSEIAYKDKPAAEATSSMRSFRSEYDVEGEICFFSTKAGQKYLVAVCRKNYKRVFFCAFAGSHLPDDWIKVNLHVHHETEEQEVGASAHAGYVRRAVEVPLGGIERLVYDSGASRVVFCGHSLGGAVSHLCLVRLLFKLPETSGASIRLTQEDVVSIGIGCPFFGGNEMLRHIKRHGWLERFITLVNGDDPVPRVMKHAITDLLKAGLEHLKTDVPSENFNDLLTLAKILMKSGRHDYVPVGRYAVFGADDEGVVSFCRGDDYLTAFEGRDISIAQHDVKAYQRIYEASSSSFEGRCILDDDRENDINTPDPLKSSNLNPEVDDIMCETFKDGGLGTCRIIRIWGNNLDFIGEKAFKIDTDSVDPEWSTNPVLSTTISRQCKENLVLVQKLNENAPTKPKLDIPSSFLSDLASGNGSNTAKVLLKRSKCECTSDAPEDYLVFYGGQFFLDCQQHAWITKKLYEDESLERKLLDFQTCLNKYCELPDTNMFTMLDKWVELEDVGCFSKGKEKRQKLYDWIVPPDGLSIRTRAQRNGVVGAVLIGIIVGGGIIAGGGLGIILGFGASLTGGLGSAALTVVGTGGLAHYFFRSRLRTKYYVMLEDFVKLYTGKTPWTKSEFDLEKDLLGAPMHGGALVRTLTDESKQALQARVNVITSLHAVKEERRRFNLIAICGPRDSGKTTLMSQLLQKPELALSTGLTGGEGETRTVSAYRIPNVPSLALLDPPGITGTEELIRNKFDQAALNIAAVFVYIREYQGLPTETDVETIGKILQCAARSINPQVLVCLNRGKSKLTEDAVGETWDLSAEKEQEMWLAHLIKLQSTSSKYMPAWISGTQLSRFVTVRFVELNGDSSLEAEFDKDHRTKGICTASTIGRWIFEQISSSKGGVDNWHNFEAHVQAFDYKLWRDGVKQCRREQQVRKEEERRAVEEILMQGFD